MRVSQNNLSRLGHGHRGKKNADKQNPDSSKVNLKIGSPQRVFRIVFVTLVVGKFFETTNTCWTS